MLNRFSQIGASGLLLVLLAVISVSHQSCIGDDKDPMELGPYEWGDYWLPYVYFKEGSWWVYESTFEGETRYDTVTVLTSNREMVRYEDDNSRHWKVTKEWFRYTMNSTFQGYIIQQSPPVGTLGAADTMHYSRFIILRNVWRNGEIKPFFLFRPDYQSSGAGVTTTKTYFKGIKDGVKVGSKEYDKVAVFDISNDFTWDDMATGPSAKYYWANGVGIIKRQHQRTGEEWHLIDYHVEQD